MHPFAESRRETVKGAAFAITGAALLSVLFIRYGKPETTLCAILSSVSYTAIFSGSAYYWWYVQQYLKAPGAKAAVAALVQLASSAAGAITVSALCTEGAQWFYEVLPIAVSLGIIGWISVTLYYKTREFEEMGEEEGSPQQPREAKRNTQENISVKEGNRIHIIRADNIHYIQAYGDYAMLYTDEGKFVKEETMKNLEATLPEHFVRIHRSSIVNTRIVVKTELYGKESYTIHLSSGDTLRASAPGYKLLKQRLSL